MYSRKRRLDIAEEDHNDDGCNDLWIDMSNMSPIDLLTEGTDFAKMTISTLPRRKQGRRVSGVFREIRSLAMIGNHAPTLSFVFQQMSNKELKSIVTVSSLWCSVAYHVLRERMHPTNPFVRLWYSHKCPSYNWFNEQLFFHREFLGGHDLKTDIPHRADTQAIFCVGNTDMRSQLLASDRLVEFQNDGSSKYPANVDLIWGLSERVLITKPNVTPTVAGDAKILLDDPSLTFQGLYVPQSQHIRFHAFSIPFSAMEINERVSESEVTKYMRLPIGANIKGVIFFSYWSAPLLAGFGEYVSLRHGTVMGAILDSFFAHGPTCRDSDVDCLAVGMAITGDDECIVSTYGFGADPSKVENDFEKIFYKHHNPRFGILVTKDHNTTRSALGWEETSANGSASFVAHLFNHNFPNVPLIGSWTTHPISLHGYDGVQQNEIDCAIMIFSY